MKLRFRSLLRGGACAIACLTAIMAYAQEAPPKIKVIYVTPKPPTRTTNRKALVASPGPTIALWNYSWTAYDSGHYTGVMVGRSPFNHGHRTTTIPTYIVPVKFILGTDTFDPSVADACAGNSSVSDLIVQSPLFVGVDFTMNGVDMGTGQYLDAFQRANFWKDVSGTPYHTVFSSTPTVLATQTVTVPSGKYFIYSASTYGLCRDLGTVDQAWFDNYVQTTLLPSLSGQGVNTANFPQLITDSVGFTISGQCCALGWHGAEYPDGITLQTYSINDFDTSGGFGGTDTSVMTHEIGEWMDDPVGNNPVPAWGAEGQQSGCQNNLEVGDPLSPGFSTPTNPFQVTMSSNHHTYVMQELAFFSWFMGPAPSLGAGGAYSDNGTFQGYAKACPAGGTN